MPAIDTPKPSPQSHTVILTEAALKPGPNYSQARTVDFADRREIWVSGETGNDPVSGLVVDGGIQPQTKQALENIKAILEAAGATFDHVVKATVYLTDMERDKKGFEQVYGAYFANLKPARSLVEVSKIPLPDEGCQVMIDVQAVVKLPE